MKLIEELAVGGVVQVAVIAEGSDERPVGVSVGDTPRADFDQDRQEGFDALLAVTPGSLDLRFKVVERELTIPGRSKVAPNRFGAPARDVSLFPT